MSLAMASVSSPYAATMLSNQSRSLFDVWRMTGLFVSEEMTSSSIQRYWQGEQIGCRKRPQISLTLGDIRLGFDLWHLLVLVLLFVFRLLGQYDVDDIAFCIAYDLTVAGDECLWQVVLFTSSCFALVALANQRDGRQET